MNCPRISVLLVLLTCAMCPVARAQGAFDPNCYLPRIGVPEEIDTIYGSYGGQPLGSRQFSPGPAPGSSYNRVFLGGYPNNPGGWNILTGGPGFNLHNIDLPKAKFVPQYGIAGHFHTPKLTDMLDLQNWHIYWADSEGNYDSTRFTSINYKPLGANNYGYDDQNVSPYVAHLTNDTVDDLVVCWTTHWYQTHDSDSLYMVLYHGGANLYKPGDTVLNDESVLFDTIRNHGLDNQGRLGVHADFRGTGREDFVGADASGNLFFYRNDSPFALSKFAKAMIKDTLYAVWQNPSIIGDANSKVYWSSLIAFKAFPHSAGDRSIDLEGAVRRADDKYGSSANFFRGGPDFGSHRITGDDTAFCIRSPAYYDPSWFIGWTGDVSFCGDLTGTGNPVIEMRGSEPGYTHNFYYVMGAAADPQVDMYFGQASDYYQAGDTISVPGDPLEDLLLGVPIIPENSKNGTVELIRNMGRIPVRLNSRFSSVPLSVQMGDSLQISPNPCSTHTVVTWESSCSGTVELQLYDVMGRQVFEERRPTTGSLESFSLDLPHLASGEYFLVLIQEPCIQHGRIIIQQ